MARYGGYFGKVVGVDVKERKMVKDWPMHWEVRISEFEVVKDITTSFLSFSQFTLDIVARVEECDGLHIVPNHAALRKLGVVKDLGDGMVECDMGKEKYVERDLGDVGGENLRSYYSGYNTYSRREFSFIAQGRSTFPPTGRRFFVRMERDLFIDEFTPKYAGTFMELRCAKGKFILKDNTGKGIWRIS